MPWRSGSPQAVLSVVDALAVPAGAIFMRAMRARITAITPRTWSSRLRMCTSARVRLVTTPGEDSCQAPLSPFPDRDAPDDPAVESDDLGNSIVIQVREGDAVRHSQAGGGQPAVANQLPASFSVTSEPEQPISDFEISRIAIAAGCDEIDVPVLIEIAEGAPRPSPR